MIHVIFSLLRSERLTIFFRGVSFVIILCKKLNLSFGFIYRIAISIEHDLINLDKIMFLLLFYLYSRFS